MTKLQELKKDDLIVGHVYCAKILSTGKILEATLLEIDNGYGYAILSRNDKPENAVFWNVENPPKGLIFYKKDDPGK